MSTQNDASQTLFRMVSLRNPQLTETKVKNFGFVQRPKGVIGFFDAAVNDNKTLSSKMQVMSKAATTFNNILKTENDIESGVYAKLLIIGRKISKREIVSDVEWKYTKEYYSNLIDLKNKEINKSGINELTILWDHLIYQVVTQKDFYVKEAISHILKAIHLGFVQNVDITDDIVKANGENPFEKALDSKIVLPIALFKEDFSSTSSITDENAKTSNTLTPLVEQRLINEAQKNIELNNALFKKEDLVTLNNELKQLEKSYFKLKNQAYDEAYAEYQKINQPKIDELKKLENQEPTKDQNSDSTTPTENLTKIEIPSFEFTYKNEINVEDLKSKLTPKSFNLFLNLFAKKAATEKEAAKNQLTLERNQFQVGDDILQLNEEIDTYNGAINVINDQISVQTTTALGAIPLPLEQYVNLGGASVPVSQSISSSHLAYSFAAFPFRHEWFWYRPGFVVFSFEVENSSWNVVSAKVSAVIEDGSHIEETFTNIAVINNKINLPACLYNKFQALTSFRVDIYFGNTREAYLELLKVPNDTTIVGKLTLKELQSNANPSTKRKNFGIKRLGVADYLKVVQSVHAYVPGLVSNIENVMASELRHKSSVSRDYSEITDTTSKYQETEKVSDTSKTSRTDMQSEVAREIDKQQAITGHTRFNYDNSAYKFEIGAEYANNTAQHDSTRQAVMKSQELTEKAMERVLTKISEERVQKIIKEYTETNVHEFDNRGKVVATNNADAAKPSHITGVYRWIDIKYKNQIYNYGIRSMFEFMVPEPARLHRLALSVAKGQVLTAPIDPRKADAPWKMTDPKTASSEVLQHWAEIYGVVLENLLPSVKSQSLTISGQPHVNREDFDHGSFSITIPENYVGKSANFYCSAGIENSGNWFSDYNCVIQFSNLRGGYLGVGNNGNGNGVSLNSSSSGLDLQGNIGYRVFGYNVSEYQINITINCELSNDYLNKWKTDSFNTIIKAYETAYDKFQEEQAKLDAEQKKKEEEQKAKMGQFYRYMEHDVLKHNCIAYLLQDYLSPKTVGQSYTVGEKMEDFAVNLSDDLDKYAALAKFMEQAFEWEIMDYTFYPYYWANRKEWANMYVSESVDPLFRSFLQSGMARVMVTVRPGFEAAVQFFLETGLIWNGGEVPVIGDPMYMSIVDEMRAPVGVPQGKYWITKLPTTLTILQDKSTGLPVEEPLPIFPEANPANCENPNELETKSSFDSRDISLGIEIGKPSTLPKD